MSCFVLTPTKGVIPSKLLLPYKHCNNDKCVQVDPLTEHPEEIGADWIEDQNRQDLAANLGHKIWNHFVTFLSFTSVLESMPFSVTLNEDNILVMKIIS